MTVIVTDPRTPFTLAGLLLISAGIPSFGTPIFRDPDENLNYIQSSKDEKNIDSFYLVRDICEKSELFRSVRLNEAFSVNNPFLVGFIDANLESHVLPRGDLYKKLKREFEQYDEFPFLQWTMIHMYNSDNLLNRLSNENLAVLTSCFMHGFDIESHNSIARLYTKGSYRIETSMLNNIQFHEIEKLQLALKDKYISVDSILSSNIRNMISHTRSISGDAKLSSDLIVHLKNTSENEVERIRKRYLSALRKCLKERVTSHRYVG